MYCFHTTRKRTRLHDKKPIWLPAVAWQQHRERRFGAAHALLLLLEYLAAQYIGSLAAALGYHVYVGALHGGAVAWASSRPMVIAWGAIIGVPLGVLVVVLQVRYWARPLLADGSARGIGWTGPAKRGWLPTGIATGLVLAALMLLVMARLSPPDPGALNGPLAQLARGALFTRLVLLVLAVLVAPLIEEFLFRGAMFAGIARSWGTAWAIALTTLAFVAVHLPDKLHYWPGLVAVGIVALANCALRLRYRSIVPTMAAHLAYNLGLVVIGAALLRY
jgi:membrane protease YdiL (CAAX protease family)